MRLENRIERVYGNALMVIIVMGSKYAEQHIALDMVATDVLRGSLTLVRGELTDGEGLDLHARLHSSFSN